MEIEKLILKTNKLSNLKDFYTKTLECELLEETVNFFAVKMGNITLGCEEVKGEEPFYHFAINIPENQLKEAKNWLQSKVDLSTEDNEDEIHFSTWNADSTYFEDPAGNIIELIARHNLKNRIEADFTSHSFLNISEIGVVKEEVIPFVRKLNMLGFPNWKDDSEGLTPVGDELGLFIVVKNGRRWIFSNKEAKPFPIFIKMKDKGEYSFN